MAIVVACAGCGSNLRVDEQLLGKSIKCPKCGQVMRTDVPAAEVVEEAEVLPADDDLEQDRPRRRRRKGKYAPCPSCGDTHAERVVWTIWGSFYGPAMFTHVRCVNCGAAYNGRTGRSNLIPAIIFVMVPLALIFVVLCILGWVVWSKYQGTRRGEARPAPALHAQFAGCSSLFIGPLQTPASAGSEPDGAT